MSGALFALYRNPAPLEQSAVLQRRGVSIQRKKRATQPPLTSVLFPLGVSVKLVNRVDQRHQVLERGASLNVVDGVEDEAATR